MGSGRPSFVVRTLSEEDILLVPGLWKVAGLMYRPKGRDSVADLLKQRACNPDLFLGAFAGDKLIGVSIATDDGRKGWINRLAVHPSWQKRGVATALIGASEEALRKRGRKMFCTHIVKDNKSSVALFEKLGYKVETEIQYLTKRDDESY